MHYILLSNVLVIDVEPFININKYERKIKCQLFFSWVPQGTRGCLINGNAAAATCVITEVIEEERCWIMPGMINILFIIPDG